MQLVVGLDLRETSQGAIRLGSWLCQNSSIADGIIAVHVVEESRLQRLVESRDDLELERLATTRANEVIERAGASDQLLELSVLRAASADDALVKATEDHRALALVIGRHSVHPERSLVQLGGVARRLCRTLPVPLIVTPPDLDPGSLGAGPIMVATQLEDDSVGAIRFARTLASGLGRDLLVAHVVPMTEDLALYGPVGAGQTLLEQLQTQGERDLQVWMREQDLAGTAGVVAVGHVADRLLGIAQAEHVAALVCGSRRLGVVDRFFRSSVGTTLAATAHLPVALVPSDHE